MIVNCESQNIIIIIIILKIMYFPQKHIFSRFSTTFKAIKTVTMMVPGADMWAQCLEINIWTSPATRSVSSANSRNKFVKNKQYRYKFINVLSKYPVF